MLLALAALILSLVGTSTVYATPPFDPGPGPGTPPIVDITVGSNGTLILHYANGTSSTINIGDICGVPGPVGPVGPVGPCIP